MNNNSGQQSSAMLAAAFGGNFNKFESFSNDLESELFVENKRLIGMPSTAMFLTMIRKTELARHPSNENGFVLKDKWLLHAAQLVPKSAPVDFEIDGQAVIEALAVGDSPIEATLAARQDIIDDLRKRFTTFNAICEQFEMEQISLGSPPPAARSGPRI